MEKFTVDLDKVLDDFEFNEEQAIRHALQHFKREDLPATKYQKPHFKPINIADADFSPCIETTMTYPTYHHNHSQHIIDSPPEARPTSLNSSTTPLLSSLLESPTAMNCHCRTPPPQQSPGEKVVAEAADEDEDDVEEYQEEGEGEEEEEVTQEDSIMEGEEEEEVKEIIEGEEGRGNELGKVEVAIAAEERQHGEVDKEDEVEEDPKRMEEEEVGLEEEEEVELEEEEEVQLEEEEEVQLEEEEEVQLEEEEEVSQGQSTEEDSPTSTSNLNSAESDKVYKDESESEENVECELRPELEPEPWEAKETHCMQEESGRTPVEEAVIEKTEIKPIQFESQLDITDEELTKYLEELEEEEEEEQKRRKESESKRPRPDTLELKKGPGTGEQGSPGLTPLPRSAEEEEGGGSEEENLRNESKEDEEEKAREMREEMEALDELRNLVEGSKPIPPTLVERRLGKVSPFWMPDHLAANCMECESKFTVIKRRHHCRACGRILCSKCCGMRASLEYLQNQEQRVCETCFQTLAKVMMYELETESEAESSSKRQPNPNNPMEYCSTVPPHHQVSSSNEQPLPSIMVPIGVLKREGSSKVKETPKQVVFSDGIRPGGDLSELNGSGDNKNVLRKPGRTSKRAGTPPGNGSLTSSAMLPPIDPESQSFIIEKGPPPICVTNKGKTTYEENWPLPKIMERLKDPNAPPLHFAINRNLVASVKIVKLECCMKETCWVIVSKGMGCVGQDEIIVLLTLTGEDDDKIPKEVFLQFHYIYQEAARGNTLNELSCWCVKESSFLDSRLHGGFLFIRPTFQCLNRIETPPPPFLVGLLIHRSEIPWARVFPFRLILRLGAEFRYYPCPLVSVRFREPVYYEIGHTIINLLADFRNLSYTIPSVRGLRIHMETNQTTILIPRNRYDQVIRALNNSNDPVLALAGNFSPEADAHLVCMQSKGNEVTYSTHAININDKPRKVTGASFVVLNGALKTTGGVAAKSSIVEDGLMVQVPSETMTILRTKLRNMEDWSVRCGPVEGTNNEEVVRIIWSEDDRNFNVGVKSVIDNMALDGVPSIRVHSGKDYVGCTKFIRWTQVFIIKCEDGATSAKLGDPLEVNKLSEGIARATCIALTKFLELLAASGLTVLAVRTTIDQDNVGYEAGSNGEKLAPIYMNELDNELVPVLHKAASMNDSVAVLELIFHIMDQ